MSYKWGSPRPQVTTEVIETPKPPVEVIPDKYKNNAATQAAVDECVKKIFANVSDDIAQEAISRAQLSPSFRPETMESCFLHFRNQVIRERAAQKQ